MFRCQLTGEVSEPKEKPVRVVTQTRPRTYVNFVRDEELKVHKVETQGSEIVKEIVIRAKNLHLVRK